MPVVLWALPVFAGWYKYMTMPSPSRAYFWVLVICSVVVGFAIRRGIRLSVAANNVVAAAATFQQLNEEEQMRVHDHAIEIIRRSGWRGNEVPTFLHDVARFGWYALSMAELEIQPVCLGPRWHFIRNPFIAINPDSKYIHGAVFGAKKQGYDVTLKPMEPVSFKAL